MEIKIHYAKAFMKISKHEIHSDKSINIYAVCNTEKHQISWKFKIQTYLEI